MIYLLNVLEHKGRVSLSIVNLFLPARTNRHNASRSQRCRELCGVQPPSDLHAGHSLRWSNVQGAFVGSQVWFLCSVSGYVSHPKTKEQIGMFSLKLRLKLLSFRCGISAAALFCTSLPSFHLRRSSHWQWIRCTRPSPWVQLMDKYVSPDFLQNSSIYSHLEILQKPFNASLFCQVRVYDLVEGNGFRCLHHLDVDKLLRKLRDTKEKEVVETEPPGWLIVSWSDKKENTSKRRWFLAYPSENAVISEKISSIYHVLCFFLVPKIISSLPAWQRAESCPQLFTECEDETEESEAGSAILRILFTTKERQKASGASTPLPFILQRDNSLLGSVVSRFFLCDFFPIRIYKCCFVSDKERTKTCSTASFPFVTRKVWFSENCFRMLQCWWS